jgi:hypothetical protein
LCCLTSLTAATLYFCTFVHCYFQHPASVYHPTPTMPKQKSTKQSSVAGKKACAICGNCIRPQAFAAHLRKCEREKKEEEGLLEYEKERISLAQARLGGMWYSALFLLGVYFLFPRWAQNGRWDPVRPRGLHDTRTRWYEIPFMGD